MVIYLRATNWYPVRDTWLKAVKAGNYELWPSLTYMNATSYFPLVEETIKGHMVQTRQVVQSTKPNQPRKRGVEELPEIDRPTPGNASVNELYVRVLQKKYYIQMTLGGSLLGLEAATNT